MKLENGIHVDPGDGIAPHVGARIETIPPSPTSEPTLIAPHVGARIETGMDESA
ncbi:hypothetical protein [Gimesia chilikensis]|uniref:hypothetical protein n=1 Tax=Gimesia chilikensis TaxID=2605989 RepID=UPI0039657AF8